jgi:hypothetical protein
MITSSSRTSIKFFIFEIFRSSLLVFAGFAIAPTHLLYSFYEGHALFRGVSISIGIFTSIWGLFYMLKTSLKIIEGGVQPTR